MKPIILLLASALAFGCSTLKKTDSQGREFVRVRERKARGNGIHDAELWQRVGATGSAHPFYIRLMTPPNTPPMFTATAP